MITQTKRQTVQRSRCCGGRERRCHHRRLNATTRDSALVDDTTKHNIQDPNEHKESSHDVRQQLSCFDEISEDNPEDELDPRFDYITRVTRKADDLFAATRITSVDSSGRAISTWMAGQDDCHKHHEDRWTKFVSTTGIQQYQPSKEGT